MKKEKLISALAQEKYIKHGIFVLRSGKVSNYYCDIKQAIGNPKLLSLMKEGLSAIIPKGTTCIAGSGYGGITLASVVAEKKKLPLCLVRDIVKHHGTKQILEAYVPTKKDKVCVIDDVYTTGSSMRDTKQRLKKTGCQFVKPLVVLNRSTNPSITSLLTMRDLEAKK